MAKSDGAPERQNHTAHCSIAIQLYHRAAGNLRSRRELARNAPQTSRTEEGSYGAQICHVSLAWRTAEAPVARVTPVSVGTPVEVLRARQTQAQHSQNQTRTPHLSERHKCAHAQESSIDKKYPKSYRV